MKIGVSSYSYSGLIEKGKFDLFDAITFTAKTGFDCIELTDLKPSEHERIEDYAERIREYAAGTGLEIVSYTTYADFINGKDGDGDVGKEIERVKRNVDIAAILGVGLMRHDATWGFRDGSKRTWTDAVEVVAPAIRAVTEYAAGKGVRTMCENHGYLMQDSYRMETLVKTVNHPNFGLLVDMGNFLCADEDPALAVAAAAPYAFHAHAKDFLLRSGEYENPGEGWFPTRAGHYLRGTIAGHGVVPITQCVRLLKNAGYDNVLSLEFEGLEDVLTAIRLGYATLKRAIS